MLDAVPSVRATALTQSYTWRSHIPDACVSGTGNRRAPCVLGVDEAGRGPVLGPLVYGVAFCPLDAQEGLRDLGFADSKTLTPARRDELLQALLREPSMGWAVRVMSPQDISAGMMRRVPYNLNEQSCDATVQLIQGVLDAGIDVTHIFVDTVGEPTAYAAKLKRHFPRYGHIEWKVARKADATYPIVGAASIAAKVTRDACLENWVYAEQRLSSAALGKRKRSDDDAWETGSGYPGDPKTVRYLKETLDPVFGWTGIVRFSWATAKSMLEEPVKTPIPTTSILGTAYPPSSTRAFKVEWSDEAKAPKPQKSIASYFKAAAPNKQCAGTGAATSQSSGIHQKDRKMLSEHTSSLWRQLALSAATDADLF